jgi:hypothetical protein
LTWRILRRPANPTGACTIAAARWAVAAAEDTTMSMNDNTRTRLSVSGMRRYAECGYAFKLHRDGAPRRIAAAIWYGGIVHRILERAYAGATPTDAHEHVWAVECGSILAALEQWSDLHLAYQASGKPNTKAREAWLLSHPDYHTLGEHLQRYQSDVLSIYAWTKTASVQSFFLRSRTLVREHGDELLLPHAVMVEGNLMAPLPAGQELALDAVIADDDDEPRPYGLLQAIIGTTTIAGVPDVVAYDPDTRQWRIGDYKTSKTILTPDAIREDAQLNTYLIILHQAGIIPAGAAVSIGHIYVSDHVEAVWADASDLVGMLPRRLVQQVEQTHALIEAEIFMPVKGLLNGYTDRCAGCAYANVCDA